MHGANRSSMGGMVSGRKTPPIIRTFGLLRTPDAKSAEAQDYMAHSRSGTPEPVDLEDGFAGDTDEHPPVISWKGKQRKSWFGGRRSPPLGTANENIPMSPSMKNSPDSNTPEGLSRANSRDLTNLTAHTYPPTSPDRRSIDTHSTDDAAVITQAAKALKSAVLHDARNIKGKEGGPADLGFAITSPHEAKVRFP